MQQLHKTHIHKTLWKRKKKKKRKKEKKKKKKIFFIYKRINE